MSQKKFGPDRFSRFDVYWIQANKQTYKQTDKPNLYIDVVFFAIATINPLMTFIYIEQILIALTIFEFVYF